MQNINNTKYNAKTSTIFHLQVVACWNINKIASKRPPFFQLDCKKIISFHITNLLCSISNNQIMITNCLPVKGGCIILITDKMTLNWSPFGILEFFENIILRISSIHCAQLEFYYKKISSISETVLFLFQAVIQSLTRDGQTDGRSSMPLPMYEKIKALIRKKKEQTKQTTLDNKDWGTR